MKYLKNQFLETALNGGFVFTVSTGSHVFDASNIRKNYWAQTVKRAGIVYRKPYSTRHTFAVEMLNSGKFKVMDITANAYDKVRTLHQIGTDQSN